MIVCKEVYYAFAQLDELNNLTKKIVIAEMQLRSFFLVAERRTSMNVTEQTHRTQLL